ncbi:MAG: T9SS type A sorting domain-containing protein, partial [Flavobacteriales bacterium]|nr:T9SS type A sorting domain-containing protein [Flavobacteriales bacterium]
GMGLFSCTTKTGNTVGEIRVEQNDFTNHRNYVEIPKVQAITIGDTIIVGDVHSVSDIQTLGEPEIMIDGGVDFSVFEIGETAVEVSNGNQMVKGDVICRNPIEEDLKVEVDTLEIQEKELNFKDISVLGGAVSYVVDFPSEQVKENVAETKDKIVEPESIAVNEEELTTKVYPNPAKQYFNLEFNIPEAGKYKIQVVSMDGKQIGKATNKQHEAGIYTEQIDVSNLPNGVYFYTVSSGKYSHSGKIIVSK